MLGAAALGELAATLRAGRGLAAKHDIAAVAARLSLSSDDAVPVGDDCAAIPDGDGFLLLAIEGFINEFVARDPWFAGWCGAMVNISDVAAMGGRPLAIVDAVWRRLLDRTGKRPGLPLTDEPDLHLLVDGVRTDGQLRPNGIHLFRLSRSPTEARIVSRAGTPAELGLARDPRPLGVGLRHIMLWQGSRLRHINAPDASLNDGFHSFEENNGFRWTDGDAQVPAALFDGVEGAFELELSVSGATYYPLLGEDQARRAA